MDLEARGFALASKVTETLEQLLTEHAVTLVNSVARAKKVSPHHVALQVPGLCHTHGPDTRVFDGHGGSGTNGRRRCAYCARRGNCFAQ